MARSARRRQQAALFVAAAACALLAPRDALASDLTPLPPPTAQVPYFSWHGLHVGVSGGYTFGDTTVRFSDDTKVAPSMEGPIYGGQIGYTWQRQNLVLGVEASLLGRAEGDVACPATRLGVALDGYKCSEKIGALFLLNARLGYAWTTTLLYLSGGYAQAKIVGDFKRSQAEFFTDHATHQGWNIGFGFEHAIAPGTIIGLEYNHVVLDRTDHTAINSFALAPDTTKVDANLDIVRARLNFRLDQLR